MDLSGEDWLNDEKFDFNLNISKSSVEDESLNVPNDDEDDEVFIGTVTHKEKCVAALVQEKEDIKTIKTPSAQEQAQLLRESALIALRIKSQETPGRSNTTKSPIAIVHPMKREAADVSSLVRNKENIIPTTDLAIPPVISTNSQVHMDSKSTSNVECSGSQTRIDISGDLKPKDVNLEKSVKKATPNKSRLSLPSKSIGSKVTDPGSSNIGKPSIAGFKDVDLQKKIKKPLMIAKPSISKSISFNGIPSAPSSLPSRTKQNGGTSLLKPLKPTSQIGIPQPKKQINKMTCGIVQPSLKLMPKKCPSDASLEIKAPSSSSQRLQSVGKKQSSISNTPGKKGIPKVSKSEGKKTSLVTPVIKATRKSIVGRKLNPTSSEGNSRTSSPVEEFKLLDDPVPQETEGSVACDNLLTEPKKVPTAADILERYKIMTSTQNIANKDDDSIENLNANKSSSSELECENVQDKQVSVDYVENGDVNTNVDQVVKTDTVNVPELPILSNDVPNDRDTTNNEVSEMKESVSVNPTSTPLLLDIDFTELSPVRVNNIDPFETGNTPPPLIQLDAVLEPERPPEMNLIEF